MMKRMMSSVLLVPLMVSLGMGNTYARDNHGGFIAGACAIGAALIGAAGAVAFVDWCCSETDEQLIARIGQEYSSLYSSYAQTMDYFGSLAGVGIHYPHRPIHTISESVLYEFATFVWNQNISQSDYSSRVWSAKHSLESYAQDLRKRLNLRAGKATTYDEQKRLSTMRDLLKNVEHLLSDITLFAKCLECHATYLALYDSVGKINNRYSSYTAIFESGRYTVPMEIKRYLLSCDSGQYAFKNFVKSIETDISTLQSRVNALKYSYDSGRNYALLLINQLNAIKDIVISDHRYQEELYQWEQARLERQRIEAQQAQARLEQQRLNALREQNRILEERNRIEQQKMYARPVVVNPYIPADEVSVTLTF